MHEPVHPADQLKPLQSATEPDVRNSFFSGPADLGFEPHTLASHHADAAQFVLNARVPHDVVVQFETAKNLYLYAWYVYRFYPIVRLQALACLELGLKLRFPEGVPDDKGKRKPIDPNGGMGPGLTKLIRHACNGGLMRNEGFRRWRDRAQQHANQRELLSQFDAMREQGLTELAVSDAPAEVMDEDRTWDLLAVLKKSLPELRNLHAHGSPALDRQVLGTLELVAEILNQVYAEV